MRVLIVGAGPTGLTAAVELARRGIETEIIDRKGEASTLSRAVGILPRSLDLLEPSGVSEKILKQGIRARFGHIYLGRHRAATLRLDGAQPQRDFVLALAQDKTEGAMRDALESLGVSVRYGVEFAGLSQEEERVSVRTADGATSDYDYVLGADGVRSATREALGLDYVGHDLPETWSIADIDADHWPHADALTFCLPKAGTLVFVAPLEPRRFRVVANTEDALAALPIELDVTNVRREAQFQISIRQVAEYGKGRVYLAGDAAHCHSPVGGRGMNLGIADAAEFAARLVEGEDALAGYSASRHADGRTTIRMSEGLRKAMSSRNLLARVLRPLAFGVLRLCPPLQRSIGRRLLDA